MRRRMDESRSSCFPGGPPGGAEPTDHVLQTEAQSRHVLRFRAGVWSPLSPALILTRAAQLLASYQRIEERELEAGGLN